tara:strand:+ start:219 stop:443 length:225 start_codon:yes stop_codon:yes gene_type:complete
MLQRFSPCLSGLPQHLGATAFGTSRGSLPQHLLKKGAHRLVLQHSLTAAALADVLQHFSLMLQRSAAALGIFAG